MPLPPDHNKHLLIVFFFTFEIVWGLCYLCYRVIIADADDHHRDIELGLPRNPLREKFLEVKWSSDIDFGDNNNIDTECCICLDEFKNGDQCRVGSRCKHVFHKYCIDQWLQRKRRCPLCRDRVV
ncbi:hypothetical protein ACOSP7_024833 [Xanthoceras sorbifolium]